MASVKERENALAIKSFSSSFHYDDAVNGDVIEFPIFTQGLTIVDLCSGGSNCVKRLSDMGANAFGVDVLYKKPYHQIEKDLKNAVVRFQKNVNAAKKQTTGINLDGSNPFINIAKSGISESFANKETQAAGEFLQDFQRNRSRYIGSTVGNLDRIKDESVDFAFSIMGVSRFLVGEYEVLAGITNQVLRKLKKGGELQLYPWLGRDERFWNPQEIQNMVRFEVGLRSAGINHFREFTNNRVNRLVIIRPS